MNPQNKENLVLFHLREPVQTVLGAHLETISFKAGTVLHAPGEDVERVLFPLEGVISITAEGDEANVGLVGREAFTGVNTVYGDRKSTLGAVACTNGIGLAISATRFEEALHEYEPLRSRALRCARALTLQLAFTASSAIRAPIPERLVRLLLMLHDRHDSDLLSFGHHELAKMLGTRRQSVTVAIHRLEGDGLISTQRRMIVVKDRAGLEHASRGFYGLAEDEYHRLLAATIRKST
jgi:CRP-like cAMP-binding protein